MKIQDLLEGTEPKLPGAPSGIKVMTPQQFVAKNEPEEDEVTEDLRKWFKEKWVRFGPDGKIRGACARGDDSEGKPKCLPQAKAHSLGKKGRKYAASKKRREDPNPERSGKAINVATKKKTNEEVMESEKRCMQCGMKNCSCPAGTCKCKPIKGWIPGKGFQKQGVAEGSKRPDFGAGIGDIHVVYMDGKPRRKFKREDDAIDYADDLYKRTSNETIEVQNSEGGVVYSFLDEQQGVAEEQIDELKCWPGYTRVRGVPAGAPGSCKKKTSEDQAPMFTPESKCPFCEGPLFEASMINEKKDACYYKVKSRYKVWPSAYASGALVKCRKKGSKNWGTGGKKNESVDEATKLPAGSRPFGDEELTSYLDRIRNKEKKKTDKYKYPYIHRSSVVGYYNEAGKKYNTDAIKSALTERPKTLLKKNEKMKHSDGAEEQFFNIGFAALVGVAVDQETNELIIVNTCPGAGSCKVDCFAMKGGKIQFQGPWLSDGRILTFLLNDPEGFFSQLKSEITKEMVKGKKGGYKVSIRWHDAGDFFSPEYMDMAFKLAEEFPEWAVFAYGKYTFGFNYESAVSKAEELREKEKNEEAKAKIKAVPVVSFYAYTKVAGAAMAEKPKNFIINWSEGASPSQERQVKAQDPKLDVTKNSRIVPTKLFYDLLVKDEKKNLVKGPEGQWQVIPDKLPELKDRLAKEYGLSKNSILSYNEWEDKGRKNPLMKWNVIIAPGEPDLTAKDTGVLSTLLLKH